MQYNPPYTLPWLRRNVLALELAPEAAAEEEAAPAPSAAAAPPVPQAAAATEATVEAVGAMEGEDDGSPSD